MANIVTGQGKRSHSAAGHVTITGRKNRLLKLSMMCENCAYFMEESPFYGGHQIRCIKTGNKLSQYAACFGCNDFKNKTRRLKKITNNNHGYESEKR